MTDTDIPSHKTIPQLLAEQYGRFGGVPASGLVPAAAPARLHIGCGQNPLPGWVNTDYQPAHPGVAHLDATQPFPCPDAAFGCIYSEHMIEHVPYPAGLLMLAECFRTLVPGGRLRIATPDLGFLIRLYREPERPLHHEYIRWANARFYPDATADDAIFVLNNFVRCWGHLFIYDAPTLERALREIGYANIRRVPLDASDWPELAGLANAQRMPEGFLDLETMTWEADRPAAAPLPPWLATLPRATEPRPPAPPPSVGPLRAVYRALRPLPLIGPALERLRRALLRP